jgi:hypothetical protein
MIHKKTSLIGFLLLGLSLTRLCAQEVIPAAGGNDSGSGGSVSYTIGQVLYSTSIAANGSVAHGVQQPYEISVVNGLEKANGMNLICLAYPNPAIDLLILEVENYKSGKLTYQLYDISGKLLENKEISGSKTSIPIGKYTSEIYFLKLTENNKETKVFKIVKKHVP